MQLESDPTLDLSEVLVIVDPLDATKVSQQHRDKAFLAMPVFWLGNAGVRNVEDQFFAYSAAVAAVLLSGFGKSSW